jgi:hypothetical protein
VRPFVRGDANGDGAVNITDAIGILGYLFTGGVPPWCQDAADTNDTGTLDITDAIYLLGHLFLGSEGPPPPNSAPGTDPTPDGLGC